MALPTPMQWAQRPQYVCITIPVTDAKNVDIKVLNDTLNFKCTSGEKTYDSATPLFAEVVPEESTNTIRDRSIEIKLVKKDQSAEYWPRITKEKTKSAHITVDWSKWKDEDELEEGKDDMADFGAGGGMPGMGGMGGMPGMEGMGGMGGMPGMGGMGGMGTDSAALQQMLANMGGAGGMPGMDMAGGAGKDSDDEEDDAPPPLE